MESEENAEQKQAGAGGEGEISVSAHASSTSTTNGDLVELDENVFFDQSMLIALPEVDDIIFDLSCVVCFEGSGPPRRACCWGHIICETCYQSYDVCPAELKFEEEDEEGEEVEETTRICNSQIYEVDRNVEYVRYFMKNSKFQCGARALGCDAVLSGEQIEKHESEHCKYRIIRYCQFRSLLGCTQIFSSFKDHVQHLLEDHAVPVTFSTKGSFTLPYGRKEFPETSVGSHGEILPLIRGAIFVPEVGDKVCLLMMKELENVTRIWVGHCGPTDDPPLVSTVVICPPKESSEEKVVLDFKIPVLPAIDSMIDLGAPESYIEVENEVLDNSMLVKVGSEKHFTILVSISTAETEPEEDERQIEQGEAELGNAEEEDDDEREGQLMKIKNPEISETVEVEEECDNEKTEAEGIYEIVAEEEEYDDEEAKAEGIEQVEVGGSEVKDPALQLENEEEPQINQETIVDDEEMYFPWIIERPSDHPLTEVETEYFNLLDAMKPIIIQRRKAVTKREFFFVSSADKRIIKFLGDFFGVSFLVVDEEDMYF